MGLGEATGRRLPDVASCGLELGRQDVTAGAVESLAVPPRDPARRCQLDLLDTALWSLARDELGPVEAVDRLG